MIAGYGVLAFRDPFGIRPAVIGYNETPTGREYMVASESVAIDALGFRVLRDVGPGEAVFIDEEGQLHTPAMRAAREPEPVHLRVRLPRAARLDHRRRLGVRDAAQHGQQARREDPAQPPQPRHRRGDPDPGLGPAGGAAARRRARRGLPRGLRQEPLHRPHLHHAGTGGAQALGAPEAESHGDGVRRQERPAGGRLHRARHHQPRDRADGARRRARARCSSPRPRRRCASPTSTASTCPRAPS